MHDVRGLAAGLRDEDFVFVPGWIGADAVARAERLAPEVTAAPDEPTGEGLSVWHFPFGDELLDNLLETSELLAAARAVVGSARLLLSNFMLWVRDAGDAGRVDCRYHRDYADNCLVSRRGTGDGLGVIVYLSNITGEDGPTLYLPRSLGATLPPYPRHIGLTAADERALDRRATALAGRAGSVLVHSLMGVHRASQPTRGGRRLSLHVALRRADAHWMGWTAWPRLADGERFRRSLRHLSPAMLALLGWPDETWPGWAEPEARAVVARRYSLDSVPGPAGGD
jgi:hypothetical protein